MEFIRLKDILGKNPVNLLLFFRNKSVCKTYIFSTEFQCPKKIFLNTKIGKNVILHVENPSKKFKGKSLVLI